MLLKEKILRRMKYCFWKNYLPQKEFAIELQQNLVQFFKDCREHFLYISMKQFLIKTCCQIWKSISHQKKIPMELQHSSFPANFLWKFRSLLCLFLVYWHIIFRFWLINSIKYCKFEFWHHFVFHFVKTEVLYKKLCKNLYLQQFHIDFIFTNWKHLNEMYPIIKYFENHLTKKQQMA